MILMITLFDQLGHCANQVLQGNRKVTIYVKSGSVSTKKIQRRTTTKSATPSLKTKKALAQEQPVALYQSDDYFGSFSDDEDYNAYIAPVDDEDDIVEASSPKPKVWPPLRPAQERVQSRPQTNEEIGGGISDQLHLELIALRQQVSKPTRLM